MLKAACACALLIPLILNAEVLCALGSGVSSYDAHADERPTRDAMQLVSRVNAATSAVCAPMCPVLAVFRNATAANAMLIVGADQAKIVYAPKFFATLYDNYGDGAIMAVVAHELGHALDDVGRVKWINTSWPAEVRADAWAGCILAKANLSAGELHDALNGAAKYPSPAHPAWTARVPALRTGFGQCGGDISKFDNGAKLNVH